MPARRTNRILLSLIALAGGAALWADPLINEFMASNSSTLADEDGAFSDWIELYNPDATAVSLAGWYLTDNATNKTKWQFPAVTLPAGGYLVVFASGKNRRDPAARLHTNFSLDADGEYLALVRPDGVTVVSEFAPRFPEQSANVSYGYPAGATSGPATFLSRPTPGAPNATARPVTISETVAFSPAAGPFRATFSLALSGAATGQRIRYVLVPPASGATAPEPTATSTLYSAPISITAATVIRAAVFSSTGDSKGPTSTAYFPNLSPALSSFSSTLPVFVVDTLGSGALEKDNIDHVAWLLAFPARNNNAPTFAATPDLTSSATITVRGSTSAVFPKKSYSLKFTNAQGGGRSPTLLDLPAHEKWALIGPWQFDLSYLNNPFVFALSNRLGRWAPRTRFAEVYFNANGNDVESADYAGIYVLTDRIEVGRHRVDLANLSPNETSGSDLTGGYILKIDARDPDEIGWQTTRGIPGVWNSSVVLVTPSAADVAPAQLAYIRDYVQRMEDALFASQASGWSQRAYLDYLDRASWVDHHLLNTFVANPDAFQRSAYFTKDKNGRLAAGPVWDFDRALGSYWDERSFRHDVWFGVGAADVWQTGWWGVLARDPEFMQDWVDRWQSLRRADLSNASLLALVDSLAAGISPAAAARDSARWPDNVSPYGTHADQVNRLKTWVTQRAEWIDGQFLAAPGVAATATSLTFTPPAGAQLAYTLDGSDPRSLGGAVAPNATLTSSPLTTPAGANVHVRSYNPTLRGVFPGSPWSSAVGGAASSPLSPAARLVNISSRAVVGAGENALIAGVVVADTGAKRYLSRAVGPALSVFGVTDFVPDPQLGIFGRNGTELFRNVGWETGPDAARLPGYSRAVGAFPLPAGSRDSALASVMAAGEYTVQISTPSGRTGVGLAELYELDANGRTVNLSTRAPVRTGSGVLTGGFVVQGPAYKRMLVRAVGPTLAAFGVAGALRDPILTIYSGQNVVATNDRWELAPEVAALRAASAGVGAFNLAANSEDAALLVTLRPGAYTVEVRGKGDTEGVALLEIYEVP
jgi:hypothetical protein